MKFKFSLDSVLKVRSHQKKMQKQKLAEEIAEKNKITQLQQEVHLQLKRYLNNVEDKDVQDAQTVRRHTAHLEKVHQEIKQLSTELNKADEKVLEARQNLTEAHKSLHIIEKVKEYEQSIFSNQMSKEEQKFLDEIATQSYNR